MFRQMSAEDYHAHPAISKSALDQIAKSPAHYAAWLQHKPAPTFDMILGTWIHTALLEPEVFARKYACGAGGDKRTKKYEADLAKIVEDNPGKELIPPEHWDTVRLMADRFHANPLVKGILASSDVEQSMFWTDERTGIECKGRPDIITEGAIIDLKSSKDGSPESFRESVAKYRYHVQAAMYCRGADTILKTPHSFAIIVVEKEPPYSIVFYNLDSLALMRGVELLDRDLATYSACKAENSFHMVQTISLPHWA